MPRDIFSFGKSNVKVLGVDINVKVRFKDVAGLKEVKLLDIFNKKLMMTGKDRNI